MWLHDPSTLSLCVQFITLAFKIPTIVWQQADFPLIVVTEVFFVNLLL